MKLKGPLRESTHINYIIIIIIVIIIKRLWAKHAYSFFWYFFKFSKATDVWDVGFMKRNFVLKFLFLLFCTSVLRNNNAKKLNDLLICFCFKKPTTMLAAA